MDNEDFFKYFPFEKTRPYQRESVEFILNSFNEGKKLVVLQAPTGIGKSAIAYTVSKFLETAYILTSQKTLQEQYVADFKIPTIKGKYNYRCKKNPMLKCDFGMCVHFKDKNQNRCFNCPYYVARSKAYKDPISVLNYAYFFNMARSSPTPQVPRNLLVLDECHNSDSHLISFATVPLVKEEFFRHNLGKSFLTFPTQDMSDDQKLNWLFKIAMPSLSEAYEHEQSIFESLEEKDSQIYKQSRKCSYLDTLICMIHRFSEELSSNCPIVIDHTNKDAIHFKPIFGKSFAKKYFFDFCKHALAMSATAPSLKRSAFELGLDESECAYFECPSVFPLENRPLHFCNIGSMSYNKKDQTKPKLLSKVREILHDHKNERGIIHTVNYENCLYLTENIQDPRLIVPRGKERDEIIQWFFKSKDKNLVLVSPSLTEGIDLRDDFSRFYIICKVPFASLTDPWIQKRMKLDSGFYEDITARTIVQMAGRSIRSGTDSAKGYILDADFANFLKYNILRFPRWFLETIKF